MGTFFWLYRCPFTPLLQAHRVFASDVWDDMLDDWRAFQYLLRGFGDVCCLLMVSVFIVCALSALKTFFAL